MISKRFLVLTLLYTLYIVEASGKRNKILKVAIEKLKLFASKLDSNECLKSKCQTASTSSPGTKILIVNATQQYYKQCPSECTFNRQKLKRPKEFLPVFDADPTKEIINCNLRLKKLTRECKNNLALTTLERMGVVHIYFSTACQKQSWFSAQKYCQSKGLVLASFESKQKITHLTQYLLSQVSLKKLPDLNIRNPLEIWVGGTNANRDNYFWVDTGQPVDADIISGFASIDKSQKCIYASISSNDSVAWKESRCDVPFSFLCEVPKLCYFQKCKTKSQMRTFDKEVKFMSNCAAQKCITCQERLKNEKNKIKDEFPEKIGRFFTFNGKKYYASIVMRSYDEASLYCCKMQMNLWTWKSYDEGEKMVSVLQNMGLDMNDNNMIWYVNARDEACDESYVWCDKQRRPIGTDYVWANNDPDDYISNEACLVFSFLKEGNGLRDAACYFKYLFICESDEITTTQNVYNSLQIRTLRFEHRQECREKNSRCIKSIKEMNPDTKTGVVFKASGRTYFVSKERKEFWNAFAHCCNMGMHLATIDTYKEIDDIIQNYFSIVTFREAQNARMMFISSFAYKDDAVFWCSNNKSVNMDTLPLIFGEPNNAYPPELGMGLFYSRFSKGIGDANTFMPWQYICQSPNKDP
ncbi:uncharacterized protein LOC132203340 [Neocloeon triangulifer]|uniref:uncharacterized protein LOC132203340 n=1 Tax=Neocloeon triangulifer TaxID=2078957 RepID=UPI00286F6DD1|nr:uncharacterized protein LOC132203340 [Neocloeon triangulifer]